PLLLALRDRRLQLRRDDAAPGLDAERGPGRARPGRVADLHLAPRLRRRPPDRGGRVRHPPHGGRRLLLLVRLRPRDLRAGQGRLPGALGDDGDDRPPGAPPALLGAYQPARARDRAAALAGRARRLPLAALGRAGGGMRLLVTGAAGFIGSTYVRLVGTEHDVRVLDKLTYAGRRENLPEGIELVVGAIEDPGIVREAMEGCDAVVNFAAESHVDRSIDDQDAFARTHVIGT